MNISWTEISRHDFFFCSNALIALARSLCKCLLAQLITASGANAVKGYLVRCACIDGTIPWQETENSDQEKNQQPKHTNKAEPKNRQTQKQEQNTTIRNGISKGGYET